MSEKYKIINIVHSGRKGPRWDSVTDPKYNDMCGCILQIGEIKQFKPICATIHGHPYYETWKTSEVIGFSRDRDNSYILETINTIYVLEEVT